MLKSINYITPEQLALHPYMIASSAEEVENTINILSDHFQIYDMGMDAPDRSEPSVSNKYGEVFDYICYFEGDNHYPHSALSEALADEDCFAPDEDADMKGGLDTECINNLIDVYNQRFRNLWERLEWTDVPEDVVDYPEDEDAMEDERSKLFELDVCGNVIEFIAEQYAYVGGNENYQLIKEKLTPFFNYVIEHRNHDGFCPFPNAPGEDDSYKEEVYNLISKLDAWMLYLIQDPTRDGPTLTISANNPQA